MFETLSDAALIDAIASSARTSAAADAEKYAAIAELRERRRCNVEHQHWVCDDWDAVAAEIAAALNIGHGRASSEIDLALMLRDRFPKTAELFAQGLLTSRRVWLIEQRTRLVTDPEALVALDAALAARVAEWGPLTEYKLTQSLDMWVEIIDPDAVRRAQDKLRTRDFTVGDQHESGTTPVWGRLSSTDAAIVKERTEAMARGVCKGDPRTLPQRRADALGAACAGSAHLKCLCGNPDCPATAEDGRASSIVIHVLADDEAVATATEEGAVGGGTPRRTAAVMPGHGIVPAPLLAELIAGGAKLKPTTAPGQSADPRYRPSTALDEYVRLRDMTCRAPGCDRPATHADIDHTIPYPAGPTAVWNLKCYCRIHHLIKTFWPGWLDRQLPDGRVIVTTPTGHSYSTRPGMALFFPDATTHTPAPPGEPESSGNPVDFDADVDARRTIKMPRRKRTRRQAKADRIRAERAANAAARLTQPPF